MRSLVFEVDEGKGEAVDSLSLFCRSFAGRLQSVCTFFARFRVHKLIDVYPKINFRVHKLIFLKGVINLKGCAITTQPF